MNNWAQVALFPGQGTQYVGMGAGLWDKYPEARQLFETADRVLDWSVSTLCFSGPKEELDDTLKQQTAIFTTGLAGLRVAQSLGFSPELAAGVSLGEYAAAVAAGTLSFEDGLKAVYGRSLCMKAYAQEGGMAAILGVPGDDLTELVDEINRTSPHPLYLACYYGIAEHVVSGHRTALATLEAKMAARKGRMIALAITIPSHCPMMADVLPCLETVLDGLDWRVPTIPWISGFDGIITTDPGVIRHRLISQPIEPVHWPTAVQAITERGWTSYLELGPGDTVSRLVRRLKPDASLEHINQIVLINR